MNLNYELLKYYIRFINLNKYRNIYPYFVL